MNESKSVAVPATFEIEVNGEASGRVHWFCSLECRAKHIPRCDSRVVVDGMDANYPSGTVCEECEKPL